MLADILGEHVQFKHYRVIPQSIILLVIVFIIHTLWSTACAARGALNWDG